MAQCRKVAACKKSGKQESRKSAEFPISFVDSWLRDLSPWASGFACRAKDLAKADHSGNSYVPSHDCVLSHSRKRAGARRLEAAGPRTGTAGSHQDGLANAHAIGLWLNEGQQGRLAASVTVPAGTAAALSGQFRFVTLATPVLISGDFIIGASYLINDVDAYISNRGGQQATWDSANFVGIGFGASSAPTTGFTYPNNVDGIGSNIGPNFQFSIVPES